MMKPNQPVTDLPLIGEAAARKLSRLEIETLEDLAYHLPKRYLDYSQTVSIAEAEIGEVVTIKARVLGSKSYSRYQARRIQRFTFTDRTGRLNVTWFNQPYLHQTFKPGTEVLLAGVVEAWGSLKTMTSPEFELTSRKSLHTGKLVAIYPQTKGVSSKWFRSRIDALLRQKGLEVEDVLPPQIKKEADLMDLEPALTQIHFPQNQAQAQKARRRLAFEELFLLQLEQEVRRAEWRQKRANQPLEFDLKNLKTFTQELPFTLTGDQKKATQEILTDLTKPHPMNRLLQGDVGSGKTVVAAAAVWLTHQHQLTSVLMAPTEILAQQHYESLKKLLEPFKIKLGLITGSIKEVPAGATLIIGTHALIQPKVKFEKVGLVIIDEQHRFGVNQRSTLLKKTAQEKRQPHLLSLTATPIPRTMALTLYGDLDLSLINELPPGRKTIKTWLTPEEKRSGAYDWLKEKLELGQQAFIICPLIEDSLTESLASIKSASSQLDQLKKGPLAGYKLDLLHGRLKPAEKEAVLTKFREGQTQVLVATPVVEVGIDIPNATVMLIEDAQRFGLSQLHQLRGRVGRGSEQAYCLLFANQRSEKTAKRLKAMEKYHQGNKLAEIDLKLRGPGEVFGFKQHGFAQFKAASLSDGPLIKLTKKWAEKIYPQVDSYPSLKEKLKKDKISLVISN